MSDKERFYKEGTRLFGLLRVMATVYAVIWSIGYLTQVIPGIYRCWEKYRQETKLPNTSGAYN